MARVTLVDANTRPDLSAAISRISGARGGRLINVYRVLLNSPSVATAWMEFNTAVRLRGDIDPALRELVNDAATVG